MRNLAPLAGLALLAATAAPAYAAESYDNCTGYIDTLPATISTQGTWCLRKDLSTAVTSGNAITVATNNVTLDCNDFKVGGLAAGASTQTLGILAQDRQNVTVRNCTVRGFLAGIRLSGGSGHLVEDNRLDNNTNWGISVQGENGTVVRRNRVYDTGGAPGAKWVYALQGTADFLDNTVSGVFEEHVDGSPRGIHMQGNGTQARGNVIRELAVAGAGTAAGILALGQQQSVVGNRIASATAIAGTGITGTGAGSTFCSGNHVALYQTAIASCHNGTDNLTH